MFYDTLTGLWTSSLAVAKNLETEFRPGGWSSSMGLTMEGGGPGTGSVASTATTTAWRLEDSSAIVRGSSSADAQESWESGSFRTSHGLTQPDGSVTETKKKRKGTSSTVESRRRDRKQQRRKARLLKKGEMRRHPGQTLLQAAAVGRACLSLYEDLLQRFTEWVGEALPTTAALMSRVLASYMDHMFFEGEELHMGTKTLAAVFHRFPYMGRGNKHALSEARQALAGWKKLNPPKARLALPWELVARIITLMVEDGELMMALITALCFHGYLRPGVALALRWDQLTPPLVRGRLDGKRSVGSLRLWALNLHQFEEKIPSKTGTFDETIELGDVASWRWIGRVLDAANELRQNQGIPDSAPLADFSMAKWTKTFVKKGEMAGFPRKEILHLYALRHGGASHDAGNKLRPMLEVQKRGSWRTTTSVCRYSKPGRLNQVLSLVNTEQRAAVMRSSAALPELICGAFRDRLAKPSSSLPVSGRKRKAGSWR